MGDLGTRPDRCVVAYPVISFLQHPHEHSSHNLLGPGAGDSDRHSVSAEEHVDDQHPPTFLWHTAADTSVPAVHSVRYASALVDHGVPVDLHIFGHGHHGLGLASHPDTAHLEASRWTTLCASWLAAAGWAA